MSKIFLFLSIFFSLQASQNEVKIFNPKYSSYEILALGSAIADYTVFVDDDQIPGEKGGWQPISFEQLQHYLYQFNPSSMTPGGSAVNLIKGLTQLGWQCGVIGKIGRDAIGQNYLEELKRLRITPLFSPGDLPTGQALCLVTPDGQRTMRTYVGASHDMRSMEIDPVIFDHVRLLHVEGYQLMDEFLVRQAMQIAKDAHAFISMDIGNPRIAKKKKAFIKELLHRYVDIFFANEEEAKALSNLPAEEACSYFAGICDVAVVTMSDKGGWVQQGNRKHYYPSYPATTRDTTGAGDLFASGFLHGLLRGKSLQESAWIGSYIAASVVETMGAEMSDEKWLDLKERLYHEESFKDLSR